MSDDPEKNMVSAQAIKTINALLGLALVLISFDYFRDYFFDINFLPTDLSKTTIPIFFSRWVTHLGAPILLFTAGVWVAFKKMSGWPKEKLSLYLLKRGLFLVLFDVVIVNFGFNFSFHYPAYIMILGMLGLALLILAGLVFLPSFVALIIGSLIMVLAGFIDPVVVHGATGAKALGLFLFGQGTFSVFGLTFFIVYSVFPWVGMTIVGFGMGEVFNLKTAARKKVFLRIGAAGLVIFTALRFFHIFGESEKWWVHSEPYFTFISFINLTKFPASFLYSLFMLSIMFLILYVIENKKWSLLDKLALIGRVPLLFYLTSLYLTHILTVFAGSLQGFQPQQFIAPVWRFPEKYGFELSYIFGYYCILLFALYSFSVLIDGFLGADKLSYKPTKVGERRPFKEIAKSSLRRFV